MPQQLENCAGKPEQAECSYPGVELGACFEGVCLPAGCGNGIVDGLEVCDDGNRVHGDGCSADCLSNEQCGNGFVDVSKGEACDDGNTVNGDGCQAKCQSPTCGDGVIDSKYNEACDKGDENSDAPNAECRENCQPARCGDGIKDPAAGELCDDGNLFSGDGCSFDCKSAETCGNGYVDAARGEQCDDGDRAGQDGCASVCEPERAHWTRIDHEVPDVRNGHAMVYDAARGLTVMFGGENRPGTERVKLGDTWTFDGARWIRRTPLASPPARYQHAMTYDSVRRRVVLFGGEAAGSARLADTWEWNGSNWEQKFPTTIPPAASNVSMAFDPVRRKVLLYDAGTWEWDGANWTQVSTDDTLPGGLVMAYDAARRKMLLVGGATWEWNGAAWAMVSVTPVPPGYGAAVFDAARAVLVYRSYDGTTWDWNGSTWTQTNPAVAPQARYSPRIAYDAGRATIVSFGGGSPEMNDTWQWNGSAWQQWFPPPSDPDPLSFTAMAYDQPRGRLVLFGGVAWNDVYSGATWEWDGAQWTQRVPALSPSPRAKHSMAFDAARGNVLLFGGIGEAAGNISYVLNDTWTWDGTSWHPATPTSSPSARINAAIAYDSVRGVVVLFSGRGPGGAALNDTWEWDGSNWIAKNPATKPAACDYYGCQLAYDSNRSKTVLVMYNSGETWEWDGTNWTKKTPTTSPPYREYGALAYDAARKRVVLFGGWYTNKSGPWEWDGTNWVDKTPAKYPYRERHSMAYDPIRQTLVVFGGVVANYAYLNDTWEWNGTAWSQRGPNTPAPRMVRATAYDSVRRRVVMFGGDFNGGAEVFADTWEWDGARWQRMSTPIAPQGCDFTDGMAYDVARKRTVLNCNGETWLWDGTTWEQRFPTESISYGPMVYDSSRKVVVLLDSQTHEWDGTEWTARAVGRYGDVAAYDAKRKKTVLYGAGSGQNETWEWDGTSWEQKPSLLSPGAREGAVMAYDAARETVILFGGADDRQDTWEWDGTSWRPFVPETTPAGRNWSAGAYDAACRELVVFGGESGGDAVFVHDTWTFRFDSALPEDVCVSAIDGDGDGLRGCADPDCAGYCDPTTCGDGACSPSENCRICAADCGACTAVCGDFQCDAGETMTSCPTDCP